MKYARVRGRGKAEELIFWILHKHMETSFSAHEFFSKILPIMNEGI